MCKKRLNNGYILFKNYKIIKLLGKGSFSFVYLVCDVYNENKYFTVKEFFPHDFVNRGKKNKVFIKKTLTSSKINELNNLKYIFQEESKNLKKVTLIKHCGIINYISFHENINNTSYLITNYQKTISLHQHLKQIKSPKIFLILLNNILSAIQHIHQYHIYHQDIKMDNIRIKEDFSPLIIDFGSSVILCDKKSGRYLNTASSNYSAIEQLSLNYPPEINESTDIYSTALLMYKILTGKYPPSSKEREYAIEHGLKDPYMPLYTQNLSCLNSNILTSLDKALNLYSETRYKNIQEFQQALKKQSIWQKIYLFLKLN